MADTGRQSDSGDPDSWRSLWRTIRRFFEGGDSDQSLRAQLEEVIAEHEDEVDRTGNGRSGDLLPIERQMLRNLLHFSEHWEEMVAAFAEHGHSRIPVYRDKLDEIIGMMLIKDVFPYLANGQTPPRNWKSLMRQPLFVPQARGALDVLADMRASRVHLAVVVDEYSGTDGIITIEDLVEEIVGEIEDEHDDAPTDRIVRLEDGCWEADARVELEDVGERIDPRLAEVEESVDTLGGLAFLLAEQVPPVGAILPHPSGWTIEVTQGNERHVTRLRLHPPKRDEESED
jgi:magnesium and cobalt transporter